MTCGIYVITHMESGKKYVGQSIDIPKRIYMHCLSKTNYPISRAIKKYGINAFDIKIIEECARDQLGQREKYWIANFNSLAPNGYNLTTGGEQPVFSEETIERLRQRQSNRTPEHIANKLAAASRPETVKKISQAMKGREFSKETRKKLSDALKGRTFSDATRKAMSEAAKRRNPAFVDRMVNIHKGKKLSDEHKAKLSASLRNPSQETRQKLSIAASSKTHSATTLQKMKEDRSTLEWSEMCAKGSKGKKQSPEQIAKRVAATAATKAAKLLSNRGL